MRTAIRRHNDEKKLKQRIQMCRTGQRWRGRVFELPQDAINKMKNGHRTGWRFNGCRCEWCMEGKLHKHLKGNQLADWGEGTMPKRYKLYYCDSADSGYVPPYSRRD